MSLSSSLNSVDPRPVVSRIQVSASGLSTGAPGYTAGYQLGGQLVFANAVRSTGVGTVATATLVDKSNIVGAIDLYLFSQAVTPAGNNSAVSFSNTDMQYFLGAVSFPPPAAFVNNRAATVPAIGLSIQLSGTSLYGYMSTLTSHTFFNASSDIMVSLVIQQY
jgi:hypothetical protein